MRWFRKWQDWVSLALALWISFSPRVFPLTSGGKVEIAAGIALMLLAVLALAHPLSLVQEVIRLVMIAFTFFIPWIFGFQGSAALNLWVASIALLALTAASIATICRWKTYCRSFDKETR